MILYLKSVRWKITWADGFNRTNTERQKLFRLTSFMLRFNPLFLSKTDIIRSVMQPRKTETYMIYQINITTDLHEFTNIIWSKPKHYICNWIFIVFFKGSIHSGKIPAFLVKKRLTVMAPTGEPCQKKYLRSPTCWLLSDVSAGPKTSFMISNKHVFINAKKNLQKTVMSLQQQNV